MLPFEFYQLVAYPIDYSKHTLYKNFESYSEAIGYIPHILSSYCKVYLYRYIVPSYGNISRKVITFYEPE